jgi:hypothetical protein
MKNTKKEISKLKYVKLKSSNNLNKIGDEMISSNNTDSTNDDLNISKPTYKKFDDTSQGKEVLNTVKIKPNTTPQESQSQGEKTIDGNAFGKIGAINFKLPKFLADRESQKKQIESLKNPDKTTNFGGSLPFTQENFGNNPNSFTTIFQKDNDKINGFQRVFRKSVLFLILQLLSFLAISIIIITGLGMNFASTTASLVSLAIILGLIITYSAVTSIFYIIVADRSYIWISLCLQSLLIVAIYWALGLGIFSPITLFVAFIIFVLSYFAYLEIEKIQVSTRFFSIGYVTSEALKILSTVAIIIICLGIYNVVTIQTPKAFISKNLINNDGIYNSVVLGNSFPFNLVSLNKIALSGEKYTINNSGVVESSGKSVDFRTFLLKNFKQSSLLTEAEKREIRATCDTTTEKECSLRLLAEQDKKLKIAIKADNGGYANLPFGLDETLDKNNFKDVLRAFYSDKVDDLNSQSATINDIAYLKPIRQYVEPVLPNIIQAVVAILVFIILSFFKFLMNIITSILIWIIWKFMLISGFAKIDIELVESEIVSI